MDNACTHSNLFILIFTLAINLFPLLPFLACLFNECVHGAACWRGRKQPYENFRNDRFLYNNNQRRPVKVGPRLTRPTEQYGEVACVEGLLTKKDVKKLNEYRILSCGSLKVSYIILDILPCAILVEYRTSIEELFNFSFSRQRWSHYVFMEIRGNRINLLCVPSYSL